MAHFKPPSTRNTPDSGPIRWAFAPLHPSPFALPARCPGAALPSSCGSGCFASRWAASPHYDGDRAEATNPCIARWATDETVGNERETPHNALRIPATASHRGDRVADSHATTRKRTGRHHHSFRPACGFKSFIPASGPDCHAGLQSLSPGTLFSYSLSLFLLPFFLSPITFIRLWVFRFKSEHVGRRTQEKVWSCTVIDKVT